MVVFSSLIRSAGSFSQYRNLLSSPVTKNVIQTQLRQMSGHDHKSFVIIPSRFQWNKFKDMLHFYVMLGVIPITALIMYVNIFIGPPTLTEIPEGYTPKHWEYQRHPISQFIAKYIHPSPQQEYEKMCHFLYEENEKAQLRQLEKDIRAKMSERNDYKAYYYRPAIAKYHRISKEAADHLESLRGDN